MVILRVVCLSVGSILVFCCHHADSMGERSVDSALERGGRKVMEINYIYLYLSSTFSIGGMPFIGTVICAFGLVRS